MFKLEGKNYNKFIKEKELEIVFFPNQNKKYILNDENVICDKIKILKNIGIAYYLKNTLVKFIDAINIAIYFNDEYNLFKIVYNNSFSKLENLDVDFNNNTTYIRYYDFKEEIKNLKGKKDVIYEQRNNNLEIGSIVIPKNISIKFKNIKNEKNIFLSLSNLIYCKVFDKIELNEDLNYLIDMFFEDYGYIVTKKTNIVINNISVFILKSNINNKFIKDNDIEKNSIIKNTYCKSSEFNTKEDYYNLIKILEEKKNKK